MLAQNEEKKLGQLIAKAWSDSDFKEQLKENPKAVLENMGLETPAGVEIEVVENTRERIYLTLPSSPASASIFVNDQVIEETTSSPWMGTCTSTTYKCC